MKQGLIAVFVLDVVPLEDHPPLVLPVFRGQFMVLLVSDRKDAPKVNGLVGVFASFTTSSNSATVLVSQHFMFLNLLHSASMAALAAGTRSTSVIDICRATNEDIRVKSETFFSLWSGHTSIKAVGMTGDGESDEELDDELEEDPVDEGDSPIPPVRGCLPSSCTFNDAASLSLA